MTHSSIVGSVASELLKRIPGWISKKLLAENVPLIASLHDIGKINPIFQEKIYRALNNNEPQGIYGSSDDSINGFHQSVSYVTLLNRGRKDIAEIAGRHHGQMGDIRSCDEDSGIYGGSSWNRVRLSAIDYLKTEFGAACPEIKNTDYLLKDVLSGLTTVSDWIGSGDSFNYGKEGVDISAVLDKAGFIVPEINKNLSFKDIFGFEPNGIQKNFIDSIEGRGVYVLEAPMGTGKTEAALYAAYKLLNSEENATGIYFALPTQLTSNKIYGRFNSFLNSEAGGILCKKSRSGPVLVHSSAWMTDTDMGGEAAPGSSWFNNRKRGVLAPFAVGTIDQALMSVINVRHNFVRTFGLLGKVIILDEIHTYDSYTGTIIEQFIKNAAELQCTVIILSATLTDAHRYKLLGIPKSVNKAANEYPMISFVDKKSRLKEKSILLSGRNRVGLCLSDDDSAVMEEVLKRSVDKEQILWVENTVEEAQNVYRVLSARAGAIGGIDCGLLHSRFIKCDREIKENIWTEAFGKNYGPREEKGRILIGTQILEQSLDIDADFLVSRLCPADMLFQRAGRLWRHRINDKKRPESAERQMVVLSPGFAMLKEHISKLGKTKNVYSPYVLCRTMEVLRSCDHFDIPQDIKPLLNSVYCEKSEQGIMSKYKSELEYKKSKLINFAKNNIYSTNSIPDDEERAGTRYSDINTLNVLLFKKIRLSKNDEATVTFLDGSEVTVNKLAKKSESKKTALKLLQNSVSVPDYLVPEGEKINWLDRYIYTGDDKHRVVSVAVVRSDGSINSKGYGYNIGYYKDLGFCAEKI